MLSSWETLCRPQNSRERETKAWTTQTHRQGEDQIRSEPSEWISLQNDGCDTLKINWLSWGEDTKLHHTQVSESDDSHERLMPVRQRVHEATAWVWWKTWNKGWYVEIQSLLKVIFHYTSDICLHEYLQHQLICQISENSKKEIHKLFILTVLNHWFCSANSPKYNYI